MPAFQPITLTGETTATLVLKPVSLVNNLAVQQSDMDAAGARAQAQMESKYNVATKARTVHCNLQVPVLRTVEGHPSAVETIIAKVSIRFPDIATDAERADAKALLASAVSNVTYESFFEGLEAIY